MPSRRPLSHPRSPFGVAAAICLVSCGSPAHELLVSLGVGGGGGISAGESAAGAGALGGATGGGAGGSGGGSSAGGAPPERCRDDRDCPLPALCVAGSCTPSDGVVSCSADCPPGFRTVRLDCTSCGCTSVAACQDDRDCIDPRRPEDVCHEAPDGRRLSGHRSGPNLSASLEHRSGCRQPWRPGERLPAGRGDVLQASSGEICTRFGALGRCFVAAINLIAALVEPAPGCPLACLGCRCGPDGVWECGTVCADDCVL